MAEQFKQDYTKKASKDAPVCNMCGAKLDFFDEQENYGFDYYVGYGSKHDMEHIKARFCCNCFDKIIDSCKISPVMGEYTHDGEHQVVQT